MALTLHLGDALNQPGPHGELQASQSNAGRPSQNNNELILWFSRDVCILLAFRTQQTNDVDGKFGFERKLPPEWRLPIVMPYFQP